MPLAINSIAGLLAGEEDTTWEYIWKSLHALTEGITALENMKKILDLSYIRLPGDLKTCLIYVCMYPEDREIDKKDLLRQWVAEGFVTRKGLLDAEDVAEKNFKALIDMCLIEPGKIDRYNDEVLSCSVHDIILELIRSKSSEMNFIHVIDGLKDVSGQIRRVSVQHNDKEDSRVLETIKGSLSHVRSVLLFQSSLLPDFLKYKYVRVLHLESWSDLDLNGIRWLFLLRYLKVGWRGEVSLPDQIGGLEQLETIDLKGMEVKNYPPDIVSLPWLRHLRYGGAGIALPDGINRLKSLHTLEGVCFHGSSVDNIKGLGELINLRKIEFISSQHEQSKKEGNMRMVALHSSISKLSASLRILTMRDPWDWSRLDAWVWSSSMFPQGSNIRELNLSCFSFQRCPGWISQLGNLCKFTIVVREVADGITIVAGLPSLAYYSVCTNPGEKEESVVIHSGIFQSLKHLLFACPKTSLTFEVGAMPKLEKLQIWFRYHMSRRFLPVGVGLLQAETLKKITIVMFEDDMENKSFNYLRSFGYISYHKCRFGSMLTRAFKSHYPDADIKIIFDDNELYDDNKCDAIPDNDEDSCCSEDDDEVVDYEDHDSEDYDEYDDDEYYYSEDDDGDVDDEYYDCEEYGGASP
ncbi:disease resistance protein RGA5-like [Lolium perenne]|uniref:disease resistance protein RGA5-like n=1 Tax=Lolium perenne TaxID=4522 RepID=UPI0021EA2BE8